MLLQILLLRHRLLMVRHRSAIHLIVLIHVPLRLDLLAVHLAQLGGRLGRHLVMPPTTQVEVEIEAEAEIAEQVEIESVRVGRLVARV